MKTLVKPGRYRHYKGNDYRVIGTAKHTETEEDLVLYVPLYGREEDRGYWVRPLAMFLGSVIIDGITKQRFTFLEEGGGND